MAAVQVQKKSYASTAAAASHNIVLDAAPTQGNLLLMVVVSDATVNTPSGWSLGATAVNYTGTYVYYKIAGSGESATITVTPTSSAHTCISALEYSGMAATTPLDKTATSLTTPVSVISTGTTATTVQADELLIALVGISSSGTMRNISSWSNSFTQEHNVIATGSGTLVRIGTATRVVSATGAYTSSATLDGSTAGPSGIIATFKIAAGGATAAWLQRNYWWDNY